MVQRHDLNYPENIEYRLTNLECRSVERRVPLLHSKFVNRYSLLQNLKSNLFY
jgi:hypothetical protein